MGTGQAVQGKSNAEGQNGMPGGGGKLGEERGKQARVVERDLCINQ